MNIANFEQQIPRRQKWTDLSDQQKQNAENNWTKNALEKSIQLIEDNINVLTKEWISTKPLSKRDVKFISIVRTFYDEPESILRYHLAVNTAFQVCKKDNDSVFLQSVIELNKKGVPVIYTEENLSKTQVISSVNVQSDLDKNDSQGLFDAPFDTLQFSYVQPLFTELVNEQLAKQTNKNTSVNPKKLESEKEDELYGWLRLQGLDAHRQVKTSSGNKLDIWIPNQMIIEVKRSNVSGNDVCQAMEYVQSQCLPVVMVGDKISSSASRGVKAFNNLTHGNKITFVTWDVIKDYLKGRFNK